jgi:hypothetical protein
MNKIKIGAVLILVLISNIVLSQKKHDIPLSLGAKISPNISWFKPDAQYFTSESVPFNFSWGFIADFQFADKYYMSTGFNVNSMSGKIVYPYIYKINGADSILGTMKQINYLRYVEIPVSVKMKTRQFGYTTYFGQIGMGFGMRLSAKADNEFTSLTRTFSNTETDVNIEDKVNFIRLSMIVAAGFEYSLGGSTAFFGAISFNNGFSNAFDFKTNTPPFNRADAIVNSLELTVGILF